MARRSSTAAGIVLSHLEFDLLWADLGRGARPYPLDVPAHGRTRAERGELGVTVFAKLAEAGFADGDDLDPELEDLFVLLGSPALSVDALVVGEQPWRLLAAVRGAHGVLAVLDEDELVLEPMRGDDLVDTVARMLGEAVPGPGEQVRLPRAVFSAAMDGFARAGYGGFERALAQARITGRAVRPLATLVTSSRYAAGQLAANAGTARSPVLAWFDTEAGRYAVTHEDVGGEPWVMVTPAGGAWVADRLRSMLAAVSET
ncbi:ESX secretion-associated protein EspG [Amycolatopsis sp. H20-H5]|uniref:ESX secretion-associated protein EspG n=1 Tax=Amycolatopsis sp. H20-H5 TaxID=3046309 RepID=UPI002DB64524|nr:ESX secretion-associated protein EspG [Amycolatopsis sp. H20-H5]MEC3976717.1 ESX secretion-associated protein EspG [Amycolatopsis sp. H20-H5]